MDIQKLIRTIEAHSDFKDILVFMNYRTLSRQSHRQHVTDIQRVSRALGISEEQIRQTEDFSRLFAAAIKRKLSPLKAFTPGVAIPVTVGGRLIKADYFYLVLATNSIAVADKFLMAYEKAVAHEKIVATVGTLFEGMIFETPSDGGNVLEVFSRSEADILSLWQIMESLWGQFLSWKGAMGGFGYGVPTIRNTVDKLNELRLQGRVKFAKSELFEYRTARSGNTPGDLSYSKIKSGRDAKLIKIKLK